MPKYDYCGNFWKNRVSKFFFRAHLAKRCFVVSSLLCGALYSAQFDRAFKADPYYSYLSFSTTFRKEVTRFPESEFSLYGNLLKSSFKPTAILLEAFASPLPYIAAYLKNKHPNTYDIFDISENTNLLMTLTAGEEDPWGVSAFIGRIVPFSYKNRKGFNGIAYSGLLTTFGKKHFKENILYDDNWWQVEWKIKGIRVLRFYKQNWSFRTGFKFHRNENIADMFYLSLFRDRIDFLKKKNFFGNNSSFEIYTGFRKKDFKPTKLTFLFGKNIPKITAGKKLIVWSLSAGILWEGANKYSGILKEETEIPHLTFIIRPIIKF